ncbi:GNAT family N-acetyltransferase [Thalassotalea nanhaiensis]|uniref:GNAT family N-acetyltransferase n=1 Tax=Thalassotalea nanhaiensis TaxID=3065648 RepID=A0ABY9TG44_9GAMM|nr:GNAT family N-acetyltransferase [Colwelliaceae bacterium SQ345]
MNQMPEQAKADCSINATVGFLINTTKLTMLPLSAADKTLYQQLYCNAEVCKHIGGVISAEQAQVSFERSIKQNRTGKRLTWVIRDKYSHQRLGICACVWPKEPAKQNHDNNSPTINTDNTAELGLLLLPQFCGNGIAVDVLNALTTYGLSTLQLQQLTLHCGAENIAMQKVMGKLNATYTSNNDLTYWTLESIK